MDYNTVTITIVIQPQNACIQFNVSINKPQMLSMYICKQIFKHENERSACMKAKLWTHYPIWAVCVCVCM